MLEQNHRGCRVMKLVMELHYKNQTVADLVVRLHHLKSLEKYTKQYIKHDLQDQYKHLCLQYQNAISMDEAKTHYLAIKAWWSSSGTTSENGFRHLELWLAI